MKSPHRMLRSVVLVIVAVAASERVPAQTDTTKAPPAVFDAALQKKIEQELIAPCCWNMTVDQHESPASRQLRAEVATMLRAGKSKEEIFDQLVAIHGERILARPRRHGFNLMAYVAPVAALAAGSVIVVFFLRRRVPPTLVARSNGPAASRGGNDQAWDQKVEEELKTIKS